MSLKDLIYNSYGKEIYKTTRQLQRKKIKKAAVSKNQLIFMEKCLTHVTPKSFRIKPPIKSQKAIRITKEYQKKLLVLAKNDAKQRLPNYNIKVNDLSQKLRRVLSDAHYETIEHILDKSKEKEDVKERNHLIEKYQSLTKGNKIQEITGNKSLLKPAVLNTAKQEIPHHQLELLNLERKFVPSNKKPPFMDIVNATEICALNLEKENQIENVELLRQKISNVISKNIHFKISNLTFEQRAALKELSQSNVKKVYSYDKGTGFVILNNKDAIQKIEEQIGESTVSNTDPIPARTTKIQKHLATLCKQKKFETRTYFQLYPSDPIPPRLYGVIKAHKPEKCYPMRAIVSTIGTPPCGISQYLVELIQPTLNKSKCKITNSSSFDYLLWLFYPKVTFRIWNKKPLQKH